MSCPNPVLDQDGERVCDCGDEGRVCEPCAESEGAYWRDQYAIAPLSECDPEAYAQSLRDAGRGHLVPR